MKRASRIFRKWVMNLQTKHQALSGTTACWPLSQGPLYMLHKCSATEPHPWSCLFDICLAMYPKLTSKWKFSCLSFPECWYVYATMLNFIPCFDHILGTCVSLLLHLPTVPKSKPSNDCILSFLKQRATSYKTLAVCGHGHSTMDETQGKHLPSTYCVPGAAPRTVSISTSNLS